MENQEIWKDVIGYEGLYQVSNFGKVSSLDKYVKKWNGIMVLNGKILKQHFDGSGYLKVNLHKDCKSKSCNIHKLVAIHFLNHKAIGRKLVVNHKDYNKINNNVSNLEIITFRCNLRTENKKLKYTSKYTGVSFIKKANKWQSHIYTNKKLLYLGLFENEYDAHMAYENKLLTLI